MELKEDDMGVLPYDMRCHVLVNAVYGCVICEINALHQMSFSGSSLFHIQTPMAFLICLSPNPLLT